MNTREVLKNLSYGVYVATTKNDKKSTGCIVNSIMQITQDTVALSVNHDNYTNECIKKTKKCAVCVLSEDVDENIIPIFGFQSGRTEEKFKDVEKINVCGIDIVKDCIGYLILEIVNSVETETHTVFLGKIIDGDIIEENKTPMTYAYYHQVKKGLTPKNAPTYVETKTETNELAYKCSVCGYVYKGDITKESADFRCPVCKQPKEVFNKI